ncbi:phage protein NinX family protein [Yokenella regensburgei]|uniref:phage protein NinX family protein n=1 Tax=Yokenella regensburgei TaxID=158877 RepID=UPI003ED8D061
MDYSQLSDFEVNNLVALAIGAKVTDSYRVGDVRESVYYALGEDEFCVRRGYGSISMQFDPCNNPADAWPIISENRISLMYDKSTEEGNEAQWCLASSPCDQHVVDYMSESKLLRAAMTVFLMMQECK